MKSVYNKLFCKYSRDKTLQFGEGYNFIINKKYFKNFCEYYLKIVELL